MSTFKIGEVAILVGMVGPAVAHLNGIEVTILSHEFRHTGIERLTGTTMTASVYEIDGADPIGWVTVEHLRKRPSKDDETSWQTVAEISGWTPIIPIETVEVEHGEDQRVDV